MLLRVFALGVIQAVAFFSNKLGFYLLFNLKTRSIYLGATQKVANRKGEHARDIRNYLRGARSKLVSGLKKTIDNFKCKSLSDFLFIPLFLFETKNIHESSFSPEVQNALNQNSSILSIWDTYNEEIEGLLTNIEQEIIISLMDRPGLRLVNVQTGNRFTSANQPSFRSPDSGQAKEPIAKKGKLCFRVCFSLR